MAKRSISEPGANETKAGAAADTSAGKTSKPRTRKESGSTTLVDALAMIQQSVYAFRQAGGRGGFTPVYVNGQKFTALYLEDVVLDAAGNLVLAD